MQLELPLCKIIVDKYFDSEQAKVIERQVAILVSEETGLIHELRPCTHLDILELQPGHASNSIDLRGQTVLPGFVDAHVHLFLHAYSETSWESQLKNENIVERTIRAANHARRTLLAGFTTVRDLGTEGAGDADTTLRDCIAREKPLIPGPRCYISNKALVVSGSYGPRSAHFLSDQHVEGISGAQVVDGPEQCRSGVRQQIGAGADWIKIYADYPARSRVATTAPAVATRSLPLFASDELSAIISTAHALGVKVAAHASDSTVINDIALAGVNTVEHGFAMSDQALKTLSERRVTWVPTLAAYYSLSTSRWKQAQETFGRALRVKDLHVACGGDTGVFNHGENALELKLMFRLGAEWQYVLQAATLRGWECVRSLNWEGTPGERRLADVHNLTEDRRVVGENEMPFGVLRVGFAADLIATSGSLSTQFEDAISSRNISFVMKCGKIHKLNGSAIQDWLIL